MRGTQGGHQPDLFRSAAGRGIGDRPGGFFTRLELGFTEYIDEHGEYIRIDDSLKTKTIRHHVIDGYQISLLEKYSLTCFEKPLLDIVVMAAEASKINTIPVFEHGSQP